MPDSPIWPDFIFIPVDFLLAIVRIGAVSCGRKEDVELRPS